MSSDAFVVMKHLPDFLLTSTLYSRVSGPPGKVSVADTSYVRVLTRVMPVIW